MKKIVMYMQSGVEEGAVLETGGGRAGNKGYYVQPTVFSHVQDHMRIAREGYLDLCSPYLSSQHWRKCWKEQITLATV